MLQFPLKNFNTNINNSVLKAFSILYSIKKIINEVLIRSAIIQLKRKIDNLWFSFLINDTDFCNFSIFIFYWVIALTATYYL